MRRVDWLFVVGALTTVFVLGGCSMDPQHRAFDDRVLNKPAPDFELESLDGATVRLSERKGKPVVLAFFAYG